MNFKWSPLCILLPVCIRHQPHLMRGLQHEKGEKAFEVHKEKREGGGVKGNHYRDELLKKVALKSLYILCSAQCFSLYLCCSSIYILYDVLVTKIRLPPLCFILARKASSSSSSSFISATSLPPSFLPIPD